MRVYLSVDMEGIAGVNHPDPTGSGHARYPAAVDLMVGETNAAIEGALAAGATEVLVNDSHGDDVQPAARAASTRPRASSRARRPWSMVAGAGPDAGFDVALFVGYHARAGHPRGTIAHTYTGAPVETRLDGRPTGEYGLNAMVLGAWGVPVGLVAGDDALAEEVAGWLPWAERVVVKTAVGSNAAASLHPTRRRGSDPGGRRAAVRRAAAGEPRAAACRPAGRHRGRVQPRASRPTTRRSCPGAERIGDRGVRFASRRSGSSPTAGSSPGIGWPARSIGDLRRVATTRTPGHTRDDGRMTAEGPLDRLWRGRALAGAWGARARASTTIGQERAILRLFGVTGLDAAGRPLAGATVDRWLAGDPRGLGNGIALPVRDGPARVRPRAAAARAGRRVGRDRPRPRGGAAARARSARCRRGRGVAAGGRRDRAHRRPADGPARDDRDARRGRPPVARRHPARAGRRGRASRRRPT